MQRISLVDETFDLNFTLEYCLSIQLSLDGFSFSILDTVQNKVVYLFHQELYEAEPDFLLKRLKTIYEESELLELPYKKNRILLSAPGRSCLIPYSYYQANQLDRYLQTTLTPRSGFVAQSTAIPVFSQWIVFDTPQLILEFLQQKHPGTELMNETRVVCPEFVRSHNTLKITIHKKHIVLIALNEAGVCFFNSFPYDTENDQLYYILGVVKQFGYDPEHLILDGQVNKHATIYHRLKQYFNQVEIAANPRGIHFSYLFDKLPDARFVTLFNSFVCV
ncbi:MAG: DUF3822 family protein [Mangrovibacterium sp.]